MEQLALAVYFAVASMILVQAALMLLHTWESRRFARGRMRALADCCAAHGRAIVIAPCKGVDLGLEENLRALFHQDYEDYELIFVVESWDDPACPIIRRLVADHPRIPARIVFAGRAEATGQKVHNLLAATDGVSSKATFLAFVDADARPRPQWLRVLLDRLAEPNVGAVTGYRWFIPARPGLGNWAAYSINCGVALLLGHGGRFLVWGGSWAIRRETFERLRIREGWKGTLSDDLVVSRILRRHRLQIQFQPGCMVASHLDMSLREMFGFLRRQYQVGRFYARGHWFLTVITVSTINLVMLLTAGLAAAGLLLGWSWTPAFLGIAGAHYLLTVARGWLRQDVGRTYFPNFDERLRGARWFDILGGPVAAMIHELGLLASLLSRQIVWRGISYQCRSDGQVTIVRQPAPQYPVVVPLTTDSERSPESIPESRSWRKAG